MGFFCVFMRIYHTSYTVLYTLSLLSALITDTHHLQRVLFLLLLPPTQLDLMHLGLRTFSINIV